MRGKRGRPRRRPDVVLADRGYGHDKYRRLVRDLGVKPQTARRGTEHGSGLGTQRWVAERAFAHLHWFRNDMTLGDALVRRCGQCVPHQGRPLLWMITQG